jgi:lipopolysaccharide export LptBFGC system permease protein LptF
MAVAISGTLWFCKTLLVVAGEIFGVAQLRAETESAAHLSSGISVWRIHGPVFLLSAATVIVSWISGVRYGRAAVKGKQG